MLCGIKFFYEHTLRKEWLSLELVRPPKEKKLPVVLSIAEISQLLNCVHRLPYRACLGTIYSCGLRLREGVYLQIADIDDDRSLIHVHNGKRGKECYVPLPERTLAMLRQYWVTHRHPVMGVCGVQWAFLLALQERCVQKQATVHTLRHSWAAYMLEAEVILRIIQMCLGHSSIKTTTIYTYLTRKAEVPAIEAINQVLDEKEW